MMDAIQRRMITFGAARGLALALVAVLLCTLYAQAHDTALMARVIAQRFGPGAVRSLNDWRQMLAQAASLPEGEKLRRVNDFFNRRTRFADDIDVWGQVDYWATPLETLGRGAGDCEDFALAKYFSLTELGVPADKLRLVYVRARIGGPQSTVTQAHMVLSWYATPQAEPLVLDNLIGEILPATRRPDLAPVFSFNSQGVWMAGADKPAAPIDRLSRWNDLILRMKAQGFEF